MIKPIRSVLLKFTLCCLLAVWWGSNDVQAQEKTAVQAEDLAIRIDVNDIDGVLYNTRMVQTFMDIKNKTGHKMPLQIAWSIMTDDWKPLKQVGINATVDAGNTLQAYCPLFDYPGPGFYRIAATVTAQSGKIYTASIVIGVEPEKITSQLTPQPDFDAFWANSLRELAAVPPSYKVTPQKRGAHAKTNLYKVEMTSFGGLVVRGWLEVPKKRGVYPVLLRVPGYEGNMEPIDQYDDLIVFSFNPRDHGDSDNTGERSYAMWTRGMEAKESYFYRGLYLDCIRAVDYLISRKDVDDSRIAIWGGSQGGGLSFATAALDQRIDLCIADIPFLSDWQKYFEVTHWGEIDLWFAAHPTQTWLSMLHTLSYFDTMNMASKINCRVIMGIGLQDDVCPPATSFATYNRIKSPKSYTIYKNSVHNQPESHYADRFELLRKAFEMR